MWSIDPECHQIVSSSWESTPASSVTEVVLHNISSCAQSLGEWHEKKYGKLPKDIRNTKRSNTLKRFVFTSQEHNRSKGKFSSMVRIIGVYIADDSTVHGHKSIKVKKRQTQLISLGIYTFDVHSTPLVLHNLIQFYFLDLLGLINEAGVWCSDGDDILNIIEQYYTTLFMTSFPADEDTEASFLTMIPKRWKLINFTKSSIHKYEWDFCAGVGRTAFSLFLEFKICYYGWYYECNILIYEFSLVLDAVGQAPSYVWRSIIWGRSLLIKGLRKRVGTGDTILVFKDPWLPRPATFRPYCSTLDNPNLLVRDLINESRSGWNMQMVRELFNVADQQSICSLPISKFPKADSWMWHYTADGTYSVKSGYFVASQLDHFDPSPSKSWFAVWWKGFWKISLPKKVLIFVWRGFHDALPTYVGLQKRKVVDHTNCPICGFSVDSNSHVVFLCRGFKKIWKELRVSMLNNLSMDISFKQIVLKASEILSRSEYELFLVAAWYIWSERNQIVHGRKANPSDVVVSQIFKLFNEYSQCSRQNEGVELLCWDFGWTGGKLFPPR
ncbi:hypothetical protein G4B88_005082 [Cannabis sativa]|uniref:Reverse transcriptase zinc-binding domain-containing protein n=1 Tax=Cannabis sativa TaxID=3483 RepID=A0A7J6H4L1_CANSA|nr:hypothetical protein G4B88_005082 [Cannabis sativa]